MRRPGFFNGTPPPKPEQKTPFIDKLKNLKEVAPALMPRSKVDILKMYMDEALKDGEITQEQHTEMLMPYFGELGEKVTEQIEVSDRDNFYNGGRIGFYEGSSLEPYLQDIKDLYIKGNSAQEIFESDTKQYGGKSTVSKAIASMEKGVAPINISADELLTRPDPTKRIQREIKQAYDNFVETNKRNPTRAELTEITNRNPLAIRKTPDLEFTSAAGEGAKASTQKFKERKVDKPTRTIYDGIKGAKFKDAAQEKKYKEFLEKAAEYPKASPNNPYDKKFFAKEFNMPETDVESIHKVIREKYDITYPKTKDTSSVIRRGQLKEVSDTGLEQEYTKLKKGEQIGNPDLAHRVSKKYNVTTSNLGLDNPLINRVIVKPNERDISRLYTERTKIENKYKLKDGTFKTPSKEDIKILEKINNDVETLARETKGRLSAVVNDPKNLNKPYGSLGVDPSKTIGGGVIDVNLKDVKNLSPEDQAFLKVNLLELKNKELGKTPTMLADEFKDVLSKPSVQKRIKNIINKGKMEKVYIDQSKELLKFSDGPKLQARIPGLTDLFEMAKDIPGDLKRAKYLSAGLKTLGVAATPLVAYDTYKAFKEGKPIAEALEQGFIGTDLIGSTKDLMALSPEGREARSVVKQGEMREQITDDFSSLDTDFDTPNVKSEMSRSEAERKWENEKVAIGRKRAAEEKAIANARAVSIEGLKNLITGERFAGQQIPEQFLAVGGRVGYADGPDDPSKRKFIKLGAGLMSLPIIGKYLKFAAPVAEKSVEIIRRGADGIPDFILDLIAKVKLKAEEKGMKYFTGKRSDEFADVYQADDFVVTEQGNKITLKKRNQEGDMLEKEWKWK